MTSTTTSNGVFTSVATQTRQATEQSIEAFRNGAKSFTHQLDRVKPPTIDLAAPIHRYFEFVQQAVDVNRELATKWAQLITTLSGSVREQTEKVTSIVKDQADTVTDLAVKQAQRAEEVAKEQADKVALVQREQEAKIKEAAKEQDREAKKAEREHAKQIRESYEGLSKAELSAHLAERGLPKTGNIEDLIERLVSDDLK